MNTINRKVIFCALLKLSVQLEQMQRGIFLVSAPHIQLYSIVYANERRTYTVVSAPAVASSVFCGDFRFKLFFAQCMDRDSVGISDDYHSYRLLLSTPFDSPWNALPWNLYFHSPRGLLSDSFGLWTALGHLSTVHGLSSDPFQPPMDCPRTPSTDHGLPSDGSAYIIVP